MSIIHTGDKPMFARVTHVQSKPGTLDAVVALYQDSVVPLLKQQPGERDVHHAVAFRGGPPGRR